MTVVNSLTVGLVASSELLSTAISPEAILALTASYSSLVKDSKFQLSSSVGRPM